MDKFDNNHFNKIVEASTTAPRKRFHHFFNTSPDDLLQSIYIAMQPGTYVRPHKHQSPDKREIFVAFTGRFLILQFDDRGIITDHIILDPTTNNFSIEIEPRIYHTVFCLAPDSVGIDIKNGPFSPINDKNFAPWAPKEDESGCLEYINNILYQLSITLS
ncbi:MAG: WbuC family cupin fold metalloprotein [Bacteroidales bacterium]